MAFTRREFIRGGVAAFTFSFAAPAFLSDLARAQGTARRNLVVLYLSGGNDALSMVVPYTDAQYYAPPADARAFPRPTCCRSAPTAPATPLGLNPRLTGLQDDLQRRPAGAHPAHRLPELEPLAFPGHRHLVHRQSVVNRRAPAGSAAISTRCRRRSIRWSAWSTCARRAAPAAGATTSACRRFRAWPATRSPARSTGAEAQFARQRRRGSRRTCRSTCRTSRSSTAPRRRRSRRSIASPRSATYVPAVTYPNNGLGAGAAGRRRRDGQRHRHAGVLGADRRLRHPRRAEHQPGQRRLHRADGDAQRRRCRVLQRPDATRGCFGDTLVLQFSEFGRRITENGSHGTDHGAASVMMAMGGGVRGGIYGTAPNLRVATDNPTLENSGSDVHVRNRLPLGLREGHRSWLGGNSSQVLGADFRGIAPAIL